MKVRILLLHSVLAAGLATAAMAQTVVTHDDGLAHDCYIYAKMGQDSRSGVEVCNEAIKREALSRKDMAATYDNRGVLLDVMGRTDSAASDFNMSIALNPGLGDPHVNLGSMLIKKRQYEEALTHINKGIDLGLGFSHIGYYDRAIAEEMTGRYKEAYYDYKKVLEIEPGFTQAAERLKDFTVIKAPDKSPS
jgi:tetratricopeptide (TPR) repeat protein